MTTQLTLAIDGPPTPRNPAVGVEVGPGPGVAPQPRIGPVRSPFCASCQRGPIAPGSKCGWCGRRAPR